MSEAATGLRVIQADHINPEFARLHEGLRKHFKSFVEFGELLGEMRKRWSDWSDEERAGYPSFKEYLRFEFDVDESDASKTIRAAEVHRRLALGDSPFPILPLNREQAVQLIKVPARELPKVWGQVVKQAAKSREREAARRGVEVESVPWGQVLTAKVIAKTPVVMQHKGEHAMASLDTSFAAVVCRRIGKLVDYIDTALEKHESVRAIAEAEKWNKEKKDAVRAEIAAAVVCLGNLDESVKRLRGISD